MSPGSIGMRRGINTSPIRRDPLRAGPEDRPLKLMQLIPTLGRGGAEDQALLVASAALGRGWRVEAAFPFVRDATDELANDFGAAGVVYRPLEIGPSAGGEQAGGAGHWQGFQRVRAHLEKQKPDAVMMVLPEADRLPGGVLACAKCGVPTVLSFGQTLEAKKIGAALRKAYAWAGRRGQALVAGTRFERGLIAKTFAMPENEITVIPGGVRPIPGAEDPAARQEARRALRKELKLGPEAFIALTVGRLSERKGHDSLLGALELCRGETGDVRFVWAGDGERMPRLRQRIDGMGLAGRVFLLGQRDDVSRLLPAADLFVLPSLREAFPNALMEAMAAGLPIVSSDAGGISERLNHGEHGLLYPAGDEKALAEMLVKALTYGQAMSRLGDNARLRAGEFRMARMTDAFLGLIQKTAAQA